MRKPILFLLILALLLGLIAFIYVRRHQEKTALILYGNVDVRQVDIGFRVGGLVVSMPFQEGDLVRQGGLMAALDKQPYFDQMLEAEAAVESAARAFENSEQIFKRRQELVGDGSISQEDFTNALTTRDVDSANLKQAKASLGVAKTNLLFTEVYAPADGTILTRIREPGSAVLISEPVYTLSLLSPVWIRAYVNERDLGLIYPGMPAEVFTDSKRVYQGHIGFISPVAEFTPKTVESTELRTDLVYRLRIIADNPDRYLKQGMPVTVKLPLKSSVK